MSDWIKNIVNKVKDLSGSIDSYQKASIIQSLPTVAYVNKAKKLIEGRKFDEAEAILNEALDISDQDSRVYKYLGKICEMKAKFADAVMYYNTSAKINPQDKDIWLRLGMCQLNSKMYNDALESFERANKITPLNTDVQTGWGMTLMKLKKYALARDKFLMAAKISKYNFTAILLSAIMEIKLCDYESAEAKLAFLAKVAPNESSTYEYANLKLLKADYDAAEVYAKKSIEFNRQMQPAYIVLGEVYSRRKDLEQTEKIFQSALDNDLENETLHYEWGKAYIRFFDFQKAREHFNIALSKDKEYLNAKIALALIDAFDGNFTLVEDLKEKNGNEVYMQEAIALEKLHDGRVEDAVEMFKKALRTDSSQTYNYLHLARANQLLGNNDKVRENFERFIRENPKYLDGFLEYSKWLIKIGDYADAQRKLRKAEKIDNGNTEVLNLLFFTSYVLAKDNVCEYNIKEAILLAQKVEATGCFDYEAEKLELENILKNLQGNS